MVHEADVHVTLLFGIGNIIQGERSIRSLEEMYFYGQRVQREKRKRAKSLKGV